MAGGEEHGRTRRSGGGEEEEGAERVTEMVRTPLQDAGRGRGMCERRRRKVQQDVSGGRWREAQMLGVQSTDGRGEMEEGKRRRGRGSSRRVRSSAPRCGRGRRGYILWLAPATRSRQPAPGAKVKLNLVTRLQPSRHVRSTPELDQSTPNCVGYGLRLVVMPRAPMARL